MNRAQRRAAGHPARRSSPVFDAFSVQLVTHPVNGSTGMVLGVGDENEHPAAGLLITCTHEVDDLVSALLTARDELSCPSNHAGGRGGGLSNSPPVVKK